MNKELLRVKLLDKKGDNLHFIFNGSRNQVEEFNGRIIKAFPSIFLIETEEAIPRIKSFSYNDVITSNLVIQEK